ncbi:MAG: chlorophyll synthesis pathway protein BchC [Deltaproteobacteria bacterium]|nr:chlorophyll synthesis pathway protein BchC [Deltaproteobacteria bacterium]
MESLAVVLEGPGDLAVRSLPLSGDADDHVVVAVEWSAISTGTERLLYEGKMPPFPGMGYPLVPGYESVGRVIRADAKRTLQEGDRVFVPGASCFGDVRGLFGGAASRLVVPASRVARIGDLGEEGVLLALAATARHALAGDARGPELIVGHGVLGRLLARISVALGGSPVVWEKNLSRHEGAHGYRVIDPASDPRKDYRSIYDVSGDASLVEPLLGRLARGGELVLAGFYSDPISFAFPIAFMREARLRVAAEWQPADLAAVVALATSGELSLSGLITHRAAPTDAARAYATAFTDPSCLKMLIDWRSAE